MIAETSARTDLCPRCHRILLRNHDVVECIGCGTISEPVRAWDSASDELERQDGKRKRRTVGSAIREWTEEERRVYESWQPGDPVPGEGSRMNLAERLKEMRTALREVDPTQNPRGWHKQLSVAQHELRMLLADVTEAKTRTDRALWLLNPHGGFPCRQCNHTPFRTEQARGAHESYKHGPKGA